MLIMGQWTADTLVRIPGGLRPSIIPRSQPKGFWSWSNLLCCVTLYYHCLHTCCVYLPPYTSVGLCREMSCLVCALSSYICNCIYFISSRCANSRCTMSTLRVSHPAGWQSLFPLCCNSGPCCTNSSGDGGNRPISSRWFGEACLIRMAPQVTVKANSDPYHNCLVLKCNHITISHLEQTAGSEWIIVSYHNLL